MGKGGAKVEVTRYYMGIHYGVCLQADALTRIIVKEKVAWTGRATELEAFKVERDQLFGGRTKEGGVESIVYWLPGAYDQVLPDHLAQRMKIADGNDCPGYRGLASIFFVGAKGTGFSNFEGGTEPRYGAYWQANNPYLPGTWVTVERAPVGLDPTIALIGDLGGSGDPDWTGPELVHNVSALTGLPSFAGATFRFKLARYGGGTGSDIRFSFVAGSAGLQIEACYIGIADGGGFSFTTAPVQVTFNEGDTGFMADPGEKVFCDWINLPFGPEDDIIVSVDIPLGFGASFLTYINAGIPWPMAWLASGNDAASVTATGYSTPPGGIQFFDDFFLGNVQGARDANPAHIIFECLTNVDWGMGSPETAIDKASFESAALTLYAEEFGLSMIWTRQASIQDFIQEVLDHIQAVLYADPATGLLTIKLIRGDYDPETLPEINPSNADLTNFGRKLWGEIVNEVVVTWTNPENEQDETVTVHDLASIVTQGGIVSDSRNYYGVRNAALAQRLAQRDLRSAGAPLASCEVEVDRTLWQARPASLFRVVWPEYGLDGVVMRATNVNYGKPGDMTIKMSLVEDVYGLDVGDYIEPPGSLWEDTTAPPAALDESQVLTLPYFMAANSGVITTDPSYPEVVAGVLGTTDAPDTDEYELWDEITQPDGSTAWESLQTENIVGGAELVTPWVAEAETVFDETTEISEIIGQTAPTQGGFVLIGDGTEAESEIALITDVDTTVTVSRGVLDTVPKAWPAGTPIWFVNGETLFEDPIIRAAGEVVDYKMLTRTSEGLLSLVSAPLVTYTLTERPWLPSRPANFSIDGVRFNTVDTPVDMTGETDVPLSWANRNRLTEDNIVLSWTAGNVSPESGQTTTAFVYAEDGTTLLDTVTGLTGTSALIPVSAFAGEPIGLIRLGSSRTDSDGTFDSLQTHGIWVQLNLVSAGALNASGTSATGFVGAAPAVSLAALAASGSGTFSGVSTSVIQDEEDIMQWGPLDAEFPSSNYATLDTRNGHPVLDFDTTTQETAFFTGVLSPNYPGNGVTVHIYCALTSATSGTVGWDVAIERIDVSSLDIDADSFATAQTVTATTVPGTSGQILKMSVNISNGANMDSLAAGEAFRLRIRRDVANDTATGDAELLRVMMVNQ